MPKPKEKKQDSSASSTTPNDKALLNMIPADMLKLLDQRVVGIVKAEINTAIDKVKPEVVEAVKAAMSEMLQVPRPGNPTPAPPPDGGVIPGSPITQTGAEILKAILSQGQPTAQLIPPEIQAQLMTNLLTKMTEGGGGNNDKFETYRAGQMDMVKVIQAVTRKGMPNLENLIVPDGAKPP